MLPVFLGTDDLASLVPDQSLIGTFDGAITEFTTAAGRVGHTLVPRDIVTATPKGRTGRVDLQQCFFDFDCLGDATTDEVLYGGKIQAAEAFDPFVVDPLRNGLVPAFGDNVLPIDLLATNINRGRDHGLSDYFSVRAALGFDDTLLSPAEILSSLLPQSVLDAYGIFDVFAVDNIFDVQIDLLAGLLAETRGAADFLGDTSKALWALQFSGLEMQDNAMFASFGFSGAFNHLADDMTLAGLLGRNTVLGRDFWEGALLAPVPMPPAALAGLTGIAALVGLRRRKARA